jgi:hypothetical protein
VMNLTTPSKIRELQIKLYRKAKNEPEFRFYQLYDKVYREDILNHAYALARANHGAPGVDEDSFEAIESRGLAEWMNGLREELRSKTYKPQPVRRVMIPKPGGGRMPSGKWMNCCTMGIRMSLTRICRSTLTRFRTPKFYNVWLGESSIGRCCI